MSRDADRLAARGRAVDWFPLCLDDPSEAQRDLEAAQNQLADKQNDAARAKVADARAALDACYGRVKVTARTRAEWDQLLKDHPAAVDDEGEPVADYDVESFVPAVLAVSVSTQDGEQFADAALWAEFITDKMSPGEVNGLWSAVLGINHRVLDPRIPKG